MRETIEEVLIERWLQWLGHLARMENTKMPKQVLFGCLKKARPFHGVRLRWKDRVKKDMALNTHWFDRAQDRKTWHNSYHQGLEKLRLEKELEGRSA